MSFRNQSFQTAARRRGGQPISVTIEHTTVNVETGDVVDVDVTIRVDPLLDVVRAGAVFGAFGASLSGLNDDDVEVTEKLATLEAEVPKLRRAMRDCFVPHDRQKWDEVSPGVDVMTLGSIIRYIVREMSGADPTQRESSSDGSAPTGPASTAGALPDPSIPAISPSTEP